LQHALVPVDAVLQALGLPDQHYVQLRAVERDRAVEKRKVAVVARHRHREFG
jgi:hypothetical protein